MRVDRNCCAAAPDGVSDAVNKPYASTLQYKMPSNGQVTA